MIQEFIPQICSASDVDLTDFIYKLHMLSGDFMEEAERNMSFLMKGQGSDLIAVSGRGHLQLGDAQEAYCSTAEFHQTIFTEGYEEGKVFLFYINEERYGHFYGDFLMLDMDTLRQDIKEMIQYPLAVSIMNTEGERETISLDKWFLMQLYEKMELSTWQFLYGKEQIRKIQEHISGNFERWKWTALQVTDEQVQEQLNREYMLKAENPDPDMWRIPMETAKQLLLYGDCPVFRLYLHGPENLPQIAAVTSGLWYQDAQVFAVMPESIGAVNRLVQRETDRFLRNRMQKERPGRNIYEEEKLKPGGEIL